jgi:hypothetical protein
MIKFFRKIRQKLLMENKTSKYFKYAIGEIILVVIGILIALQLNNWNQNRIDKIKSQEYHQRIIEDLDQLNTILSKESKRALRVQKYLSASVKILRGKELTKKNKDTLDLALNNYFQMVELQESLGTYEELKSSGQLGLIYNKDLRKKLNKYVEALGAYSKIITLLASQVNKTEPIDKHVTLSVAEEFPLNKISLQYDFDLLKKDNFLINTLSRYSLHWKTKSFFSNNMLEVGESLKKNILKELSND